MQGANSQMVGSGWICLKLCSLPWFCWLAIFQSCWSFECRSWIFLSLWRPWWTLKSTSLHQILQMMQGNPGFQLNVSQWMVYINCVSECLAQSRPFRSRQNLIFWKYCIFSNIFIFFHISSDFLKRKSCFGKFQKKSASSLSRKWFLIGIFHFRTKFRW